MFSSEDAKRDYTIMLVDKLLACGMDRAETRESVLRLIPEIKQYIVIGDTDKTSVLNIVQKCIDFPNGVEQLTFALHEVIGPTALLSELDKFVQTLFPATVSYAGRRKLLHLASEMRWPPDVLMKAYRRSIPENWPFPERSEGMSLLTLMLHDLVKIGRQDSGAFPVLEFVERLALYAQKEEQELMRDRLQEWVEQRAFKLKLDDNHISRMRARIEQEEVYRIGKVPYLLIMFDTASASSATNIPVEDRLYTVQAWLVDETASLLSEPIVLDDAPRKLEEVPQWLGSLLEKYQKVESLTNDIDNLVIEFLVPDELLNYGFDAWQVQMEDDEFELGIQYHVVVRSARRATASRHWSAWKNKWTFLQKALKAGCSSEDFVCICGPEGCQVRGDSSCAILFCSRAECQEQDRLKAVLRRSPIVYLALAHTNSASPTGSSSTHGNRVFQTIIHAGMPIALWPRKRASSAESIKSLLSYDALASLPEAVWKWRKNVVIVGEEPATEQQLSLMWDDPFRLPPAATATQFGAPTRNE